MCSYQLKREFYLKKKENTLFETVNKMFSISNTRIFYCSLKVKYYTMCPISKMSNGYLLTH